MDRTPDGQQHRRQRLHPPEASTANALRQVPPVTKLVPLKPLPLMSLPTPVTPNVTSQPEGKRLPVPASVKPTQHSLPVPERTTGPSPAPVMGQHTQERPKLPVPMVTPTYKPVEHKSLAGVEQDTHSKPVLPSFRSPLSTLSTDHLPTLTPPVASSVGPNRSWESPERRDWLELLPQTVEPIRYSDL